MFHEALFFLPRLQNLYKILFFFQPRCLGINQIYTRIFSSVDFKTEQLFQQDSFFDFIVFLWTFWLLLRINDTEDLIF